MTDTILPLTDAELLLSRKVAPNIYGMPLEWAAAYVLRLLATIDRLKAEATLRNLPEMPKQMGAVSNDVLRDIQQMERHDMPASTATATPPASPVGPGAEDVAYEWLKNAIMSRVLAFGVAVNIEADIQSLAALIRTERAAVWEMAAQVAKKARSHSDDPVADQEWNAACDAVHAAIQARSAT